MHIQAYRHQAHEAFDSLWKRKPFHIRANMRTGCYRWLRRHMNLSLDDCHIAKMNQEQCLEVVRLCQLAEAGIIDKPREHKGADRHFSKLYRRSRRERISK